MAGRRRDWAEDLADDVRAGAGLVHALKTGLVGAGIVNVGSRPRGQRRDRAEQLADEGCLPPPARRAYPLVPAIQGLLRHYGEREEKRTVLESYDGLGACSAALHIPITTLRYAKRNGCPAFRSGRIHVAPLIQWLFDSANQSPVNYDHERAQQVVL